MAGGACACMMRVWQRVVARLEEVRELRGPLVAVELHHSGVCCFDFFLDVGFLLLLMISVASACR